MKGIVKEKVFVYFFLFFLIALILNFKKIEAGSEHNVWGWAWSENIGWISFNSIDCDSDSNGFVDIVCGGDNSTTPSFNYGVHINPATGYFTGYGWSENVGWIKFDPPGPYPAAPNYSVRYFPDTDYVSGWARVYSQSGYGQTGYGWISMSDGSPPGTLHQVVVDTGGGGPPYEFRNWAWGDENLGWISMNCLETGTCGVVDYKVMTSIVNEEPYAESLVVDGTPTYCNIGPGMGQVRFNWTYQDIEGDLQDQYNLQVDDNFDFSSPIVDYTAYQTVNPGEIGTSAVVVVTGSPTPGALEVGYRGTYYWRIRVKAVTGDLNWSNWVEYNDVLDSDGDGNSKTFTTPPKAYPYPDFTFNPEYPKIEEEVTFTNLSKCYDSSDIEYDCSTLPYMLHEWNYGDGSPLEYDPPDPITNTYMDEGDYTVGLRVTNTNDPTESCLKEKALRARLPAPGWKETAPF